LRQDCADAYRVCAGLERALIHQRTGAGRDAARARGVRFGRPPKLTAEQVVVARRLIDAGTAVRRREY
jgi:DNA invertase Pin-like site-specific DNA recombinase